MLKPIRAAAPRLAFAVYCLLTLVASEGFRSDELECEETLVHLDECCAELNIGDIGCNFYSQGCESPAVHPLIGEGDAECIKSLNCEQVQGRGICERVAEAHAERGDPFLEGDDHPSARGLCQ